MQHPDQADAPASPPLPFSPHFLPRRSLLTRRSSPSLPSHGAVVAPLLILARSLWVRPSFRDRHHPTQARYRCASDIFPRPAQIPTEQTAGLSLDFLHLPGPGHHSDGSRWAAHVVSKLILPGYGAHGAPIPIAPVSTRYSAVLWGASRHLGFSGPTMIAAPTGGRVPKEASCM